MNNQKEDWTREEKNKSTQAQKSLCGSIKKSVLVGGVETVEKEEKNFSISNG